MAEAEGPEIKWGRCTGSGGKHKKVKFYESFTFDGVEYFKYDCVYLFKEDEPEPYVGKILKLWESNKQKKGKVLWFFHPEEISNFIGSEDVIENEVFLASGEATGLVNINPLEAIAGKCNVVCISKDSRNPQPTDEQIRQADFVFRRTFDVGCFQIKDEIDNQIAGMDVTLLLNRMVSPEGSGAVKVSLETKEVSENAVQNDLTVVATSQENGPKDSEAVKINGHCNDKPANGASALNALSINPESPTREKTVSDAGADTGNAEKTDQAKENVSDPKAASKSKVESKKRKDKVGKFMRHESEGKIKRAKDFDESDEKPSKKAKLTSEKADKGKNVMVEPIVNTDDTAMETLPPTSTTDIKTELKDTSIEEEGPSKKLKLVHKKAKLSNCKLLKTPSQESCDEDQKKEEQELAITTQDKSRWFKDLPWEDELKDSHEQGKLVLLQNLDPSCTSAEVKDIITQVFNRNCKAKMVQRTAISSPHSGQAFVIFDSRDTAEMVVKQLEERCLLLSDGRPLVASPGNPCFPEKKQTFFGHLIIDKLRCNMHREQKDAVSTSHCAQPNTIEYEMATEWCLLQARSELAWKKLYEKHEQDVRKLKAQLKTRR